jgi:hypothetical protein
MWVREGEATYNALSFQNIIRRYKTIAMGKDKRKHAGNPITAAFLVRRSPPELTIWFCNSWRGLHGPSRGLEQKGYRINSLNLSRCVGLRS